MNKELSKHLCKHYKMYKHFKRRKIKMAKYLLLETSGNLISDVELNFENRVCSQLDIRGIFNTYDEIKEKVNFLCEKFVNDTLVDIYEFEPVTEEQRFEVLEFVKTSYNTSIRCDRELSNLNLYAPYELGSITYNYCDDHNTSVYYIIKVEE